MLSLSGLSRFNADDYDRLRDFGSMGGLAAVYDPPPAPIPVVIESVERESVTESPVVTQSHVFETVAGGIPGGGVSEQAAQGAVFGATQIDPVLLIAALGFGALILIVKR